MGFDAQAHARPALKLAFEAWHEAGPYKLSKPCRPLKPTLTSSDDERKKGKKETKKETKEKEKRKGEKKETETKKGKETTMPLESRSHKAHRTITVQKEDKPQHFISETATLLRGATPAREGCMSALERTEVRKEKGSDIQRKVAGYPHRPDRPPPVQRTHRGWPALGGCKDWVLHRIEGEFRRSALGECSRSREGARVETANVRRYSSGLEKGGGRRSPF